MALVVVTDENFRQLAAENSLLILDFWAPWCGICNSLAPQFAAASERHPDVLFGKVNAEQQPALAEALGVRSLPTKVVVRDEIQLITHAGQLPAAAIDQMLAQVRALDMAEINVQL